MGDYNLNALNPRDFEHLTQALAQKVIAAGVTPFGDGPDGGREATYKGSMLYPSLAQPWNGYLVIQSKFNIRPSGDSAKDGAWALNQLSTDLAKFADPKRHLPKPDYYIFVTNVVLTPVQEVGSKDKAIALLEQSKAEKLIKDYDVWDFDKLCRLIDGQADIRRAYAAFITPGDVLTEMMQWLQGQQPDFAHIMSLFLQKELRSDQFVKLEQAGATTDQKIALANVFTDVPASHQVMVEPPSNEQDPEYLPPGIVNELLSVGAQILRPSVRRSNTSPDHQATTPTVQPGRFVIVGGPGQGKSTLGQFLCQLYRSTILAQQPTYTLAPEAQTVLDLFVAQCQASAIDLPKVRRFPVRVVLDQFATDLAQGKVTSLRSFIVQRIKQLTDYECTVADLHRWLKAFPWIIVFDGLDEVPATSNRDQVLEAIMTFLEDATISDADVLIVATTRPQGYSDDFSPHYYQHRYLVPLSNVRAMVYAQRLTEARYGNDPDRKERVLRRLKAALQEETTARLMRSPLQITIMAVLVDRIGHPPQERWRMFHMYYEVIYLREMEREIAASLILRQHKADVDAIHHRVGLLLQLESERAGTTDAQLSVGRFDQLVRARLAEEGFEGNQLELRAQEITAAALNRLVFLVGLKADRIGFEIRSFQEFTAAEALMNGSDTQIRSRLEAIAPSSHWRNVFLFATGKCFAERQSLRDMIVTICTQLNNVEHDRLAGVTLVGSRLALDISNDGVAREQPKYARLLSDVACRLLDFPDVEANMQLAAIFNESLENLFRTHLRQRLGQRNLEQQLAAWAALKVLADKHIPWAEELASQYWPTDPIHQCRIFQFIETQSVGPWFGEKLLKLIPMVEPWKLSFLRSLEHIMLPSEQELPDWFNAVNAIVERDFLRDTRLQIPLLPQGDAERVLSLRLGSVQDTTLLSITAITDMPFHISAWTPYIAAVKFAQQPRAVTLAHELRWLSQWWDRKQAARQHNFAWPLATCLSVCETTDDLVRLTDQVEKGQLGDFDDWVAAEQRWLANGVVDQDLAFMTDERQPYTASIRDIGFPLIGSGATFSGKDGDVPTLWRVLYDQYQLLPLGQTKRRIADLALQRLATPRLLRKGGLVHSTPDQLKQLFEDQLWHHFDIDLLHGIALPANLDEAWLSFFEWLSAQRHMIWISEEPWEQSIDIARAYTKDPSRHNLIWLMMALVICGSECSVPAQLLELNRFDTEELRCDALIVRLAQGGWSPKEARTLAAVCASFPAELEAVQLAVMALEKQQVAPADAESFLVALYEQLLATDSRELGRLVELLNKVVRTRAGQLDINVLDLPSLE